MLMNAPGVPTTFRKWTGERDMSEHLDPYRLPRSVRPVRYDLTLAPDLEQATFSGSVTISVDVVEPTSTVWLNAAELEVNTAALEDAAGHRIDISQMALHEETERVM